MRQKRIFSQQEFSMIVLRFIKKTRVADVLQSNRRGLQFVSLSPGRKFVKFFYTEMLSNRTNACAMKGRWDGRTALFPSWSRVKSIRLFPSPRPLPRATERGPIDEGGGKNRIVRFVGPAALTPQAQPVIHQGLTNPSNVKYPSNPPLLGNPVPPLFSSRLKFAVRIAIHTDIHVYVLYTTSRAVHQCSADATDTVARARGLRGISARSGTSQPCRRRCAHRRTPTSRSWAAEFSSF